MSERDVDPDVTSDPNLDDPHDDARDEEERDEGTSSDWTSEGGAMQEGPATHAAAADD